MKEKLENEKHTGRFSIPPAKEIFGELLLDGSRTSLLLHDKEFFDTRPINDDCITGILRDLTRVTLINCVTAHAPGSAGRGDEFYYFANVFPHFVVYGERHISPREEAIKEVHFVIDDASTLFYDFDAFGMLFDAVPFMEQIVQAKTHDRDIPIGPNPKIFYFAGKQEIFSVDTKAGRISASHNLSHNMGGPEGIHVDNSIFVSLTFDNLIRFSEAIDEMCSVLRFLELLVGRPQNLRDLSIGVEPNGQERSYLQVYWCMPPKREPSNEGRKPHPSDVLLDPIRSTEAFLRVSANWFERQTILHDSRMRFSSCFAKQNEYDIDRLIGSANMFDILPASAVPKEVELTQELEDAKRTCRDIFLALRPSAERSSVLNALGRVGKSNLKQKIRYRAGPLIYAMGDRLPELLTVTDEAVNCRNHYVHGTESEIDYNNNFDVVIFFTTTLEFVFAASDLIEAGWDAKAWSKLSTVMTHPFSAYRINYAENLKELKRLLS